MENRDDRFARLRLIENECNDYLEMLGWMTLNDVYKKLGLPQTEEGKKIIFMNLRNLCVNLAENRGDNIGKQR